MSHDILETLDVPTNVKKFLFSTTGRVSSRHFYERVGLDSTTVNNYKTSSDDLYNTVNVTFPELIPA